MSLAFMVLGAPRSGTTWMANLLTTDTTWCIHDPALEYTLDQITQIEVPGKRVGISCTSSLLHPDWVNKQKCPKVILYRHPDEVNASLRALGMLEIQPNQHHYRVNQVKAPLFQWTEIFKEHVARAVCEHLGVPFDIYRFRELSKMNIQPQWNRLPVAREALMELSAAIARAGLEQV